MSTTQKDLLSIQSLVAGYGETTVIEDVSFAVRKGESLSIIGRNGVGKSTLLKTIVGLTNLQSGTILFDDRDLSTLPTNRRNAAGIGYVPQEREIFPSLTVAENLAVASRPGDITREYVLSLFPALTTRLSHMGNQLSGGEQQMLAIGRALVGNPNLLLLDEPSEGLAPVIVEQLEASLSQLRNDHDMTMLLVEQNSRVALAMSARCIVLVRGQIAFDGPSQSLRDDPSRLEALVGLNA